MSVPNFLNIYVIDVSENSIDNHFKSDGLAFH